MIAVIGGGWAGCAAAVELARSGHQVELHESGATLGGRARRVVRNGLPLDNGEHLLLGAYTETLALAQVVHDNEGDCPWITRPLAMGPFASGQPEALSLRARRLPAPFGVLAGLLGASGLTWPERAATIHWFIRQKRRGFRCNEDTTVATLLAELPPRVRDALWGPLCLAALNTPPQRASGQVFSNVLRETFGGGARATDMVMPRIDLADAIPERAGRWLTSRGHAVRMSTRTRLRDVDAAGVSLECASGVSRADAVVVAVGPHQLAAAIEPEFRTREPRVAHAVRDIERFSYEPITTVYLGYASAYRLPAGLVRLDDAPGQWIFDRTAILARASPSASRPEFQMLLSVVISAHGPHETLAHPALTAAIDTQLRRLAPDLPALRWSQVIEEKRATYACVPSLARPVCGRLAERTYLAGDYTYAAFPATLEAAVRSGVAAARALIRDFPP